jgi:chromosome segregation ATPase
MGIDETSFLLTGLLLVLIFIFVVIGVLFLLIHYWQHKTERDIKKARREIRRLQSEHQLLTFETQIYSSEDPEPYGVQAASLATHLEVTYSQIQDLLRQYASLNEKTRQRDSKRWRRAIHAPYFWYQLRQDVASLNNNLASVGTSLDSAMDFKQAFRKLEWQIALQARDVNQLQLQLFTLLDSLRAKNLQGDSLETAVREAENCNSALAQIPNYLTSASQKTVHERADKETIIKAYAILSETQPKLEEMLTQVQSWENQYSNVVEKVLLMRGTVSSVEGTLKSIPAELMLSSNKTQFDQIKVVSQNLNATISKLEVEKMDQVAGEASRLNQTALDMDDQLTKLRRGFEYLSSAILELSTSLKRESQHFTALGTAPVYPIAWESSVDTLSGINMQAAKVGSINKTRVPKQVEEDLGQAARLNTEIKTLTQYRQQIETQHSELTAILATPEFQQVDEWLGYAQQIAERTQHFSPENWERGEAVSNLPPDLVELEKEILRLVPDSVLVPVEETDITALLENTRSLASSYEKMRARVERVRDRLEVIQKKEKSSQEQLLEVQTALYQIKYVIKSNSHLSNIATREYDRLQKDHKKLDEGLKDREHGFVDKKAKRVETLTARIEHTGNHWLEEIDTDIETKTNLISESLNTLDSIAFLEENAVESARQLISSGLVSSQEEDVDKVSLPLTDLPAELKRRSDTWQTCSATIRALEDVEKPVVETFNEANQNRQKAKHQYKKLNALLRGKQKWPPTSVSLAPARQELDLIEKNWVVLKKESSRAISIVAQLGSLSAKYQRLETTLRQETERAAHEQAQIAGLEAEFDELAKIWLGLRKMYRDKPLAKEGIKELLAEMNHEWNQTKRGYKQGESDYNEILQALGSLVAKARSAHVMIDHDHLIDVNGSLIPYKG